MSKHGNCECKICGLRGYSKNVTCRNVFPAYGKDGHDYTLQSFENTMVARWDEKTNQYLFGSNRGHYDGTEGNMSLADTLIDYLSRETGDIENLRILLCVHQWVQDEGTESV